MENELEAILNKTTGLSPAEQKALLNERDRLRTQQSRTKYGLTLGAVLLFLGLGAGQLMLCLAGGIAVGIGLYFRLLFNKQIERVSVPLRPYYPDGIPERKVR